MSRNLVIALFISTSLLLGGCAAPGAPGNSGGGGQAASPGVAAQTAIVALQTWLALEQNKARAAGQTARANTAGELIGSLTSLRTESNCANRLRLATTISAGLQSEFPTYQAQLGLGTNLVGILAAGYPGCQ